MYNAFRDMADFLHLLAMVLLMVKFLRTKSCANISGKTQILFAIVFTMRYLDVFATLNSLYLTVMKFAYVALTYLAVFMIYGPFKKTHDRENDTFFNEFLVVPCFVFALRFSDVSNSQEIMWTFSIFLEAVAIIPQLDLLCKIDFIDNYSVAYLVSLGLYRALYILNWAYRYHFEGYYEANALFAGFLMTMLFALVFIRLYILKRRERMHMIAVVA